MNRITSVVIVPLFEKNGEINLLFTKRNQKLKHHAGEISFPGGKVENGEKFFEAAKRETLEEINCSVIKTIGTLKPVMTLVSDHLILPYIAYIDTRNLIPNDVEVESIHTITIKKLLKTKMQKRRFPYKRLFITTPVWEFDDFYVWGATGRILLDFKKWLKKQGRKLHAPDLSKKTSS
jgi:8-oxo-dGTP pyrophosphatase MutT (NUDIX family)